MPVLDSPDWLTGGHLYSVDTDVSNTRLVIGCAQGIKVWNLAPVLSASDEVDPDVPKLLAHITDHAGDVLIVRFSPDGKRIGSGGDDKAVFVFEMQQGLPGRGALGSSTRNVENWRKVGPGFRGHHGDVTGLDWSPDGRMLVSCSIDNTVVVWDVAGGGKPILLKGHKSTVKGVAWDPLGKFIASQAEDRSMIIWRTDSWSAAQVVRDAFPNQCSSAMFMRCHWAPTGQHLVAVNSLQKGQHTAVMWPRGNYDVEQGLHSLAGHHGSIVCARMSRRMYYTTRDDGDEREIGCYVALGGSDNVVSLFALQGASGRAIKNLPASVRDLCWTADGTHLIVACFTGAAVTIRFSEEELGEVVPQSVVAELMQELSNAYSGPRINARLPESAAQLAYGATANGIHANGLRGPVRAPLVEIHPSGHRMQQPHQLPATQLGIAHAAVAAAGVAQANAAPVAAVAAAVQPLAQAVPPVALPAAPARELPSSEAGPGNAAAQAAAATAPAAGAVNSAAAEGAPGLAEIAQPVGAVAAEGRMDGRTAGDRRTEAPTAADGRMDGRTAAADGRTEARTAAAEARADGRPPIAEGRTDGRAAPAPDLLASRMGPGAITTGLARKGSVITDAHTAAVRPSKVRRVEPQAGSGPSTDASLRTSHLDPQTQAQGPILQATAAPLLSAAHVALPAASVPVPSAKPKLSVLLERSMRTRDGVEAQEVTRVDVSNPPPSTSGRIAADIVCSCGDRMLWRDSVEGRVLCLAGSPMYVVLATDQWELLVYTRDGQLLLPALHLSSLPVALTSDGGAVTVVVTSDAMMQLWDWSKTALLAEKSLLPLLAKPYKGQPATLAGVRLSANGLPLVILSSHQVFVLHNGQAWLKVTSDSYPQSVFQSRIPDSNSEVQTLQAPWAAHVSTSVLIQGATQGRANQQAADSRAHLQLNLAAAQQLGNVGEFRAWLAAYARYLANALDEHRLRGLCQRYVGPDASATAALVPSGPQAALAAGATAGDGVRQHVASTPWQPHILGVHKRQLLKDVILPEIFRKRELQRLYNEIEDMLVNTQQLAPMCIDD